MQPLGSMLRSAAEKGEIDFDFAKKCINPMIGADPDTKKWHYNEPESPMC